jgi:hypothetical protein
MNAVCNNKPHNNQNILTADPFHINVLTYMLHSMP